MAAQFELHGFTSEDKRDAITWQTHVYVYKVARFRDTHGSKMTRIVNPCRNAKYSRPFVIRAVHLDQTRVHIYMLPSIYR